MIMNEAMSPFSLKLWLVDWKWNLIPEFNLYSLGETSLVWKKIHEKMKVLQLNKDEDSSMATGALVH